MNFGGMPGRPGPGLFEAMGSSRSVSQIKVEAAEGFEVDRIARSPFGGLFGMGQGRGQVAVALMHGIGQIVQDPGIAGIQSKGGIEQGNGLLRAALTDQNVPAADKAVDIHAVPQRLVMERFIGGRGPAIKAPVEPEIGQQKLLLPGRLAARQLARPQQAEGGMLKGFTSAEKYIFRHGLDVPGAVQQFNGPRAAIPGNGHAGTDIGMAGGVRRQQNQQGRVPAEFGPEGGRIGLNRQQQAVVLPGGPAEGGAVKAAGPGGRRNDFFRLCRREPDAVGGKKRTDQRAVRARISGRNPGDT